MQGRNICGGKPDAAQDVRAKGVPLVACRGEAGHSARCACKGYKSQCLVPNMGQRVGGRVREPLAGLAVPVSNVGKWCKGHNIHGGLGKGERAFCIGKKGRKLFDSEI